MGTIRNLTVIPSFDEIVFECRNKEYGAYKLRKEYRRNVALSLAIAVAVAVLSIIIPYFKMKAAAVDHRREDRIIANLVMTNMDQPLEKINIPETPPPPEDAVQQAKYIPPVVVDSVRPEDDFQLLTADEAEEVVQNEEVIDVPIEVQPEVQDVEPKQEIFTVVEEMPSFPGGNDALLAYVYEHVVYPEIAIENNIQGRVTVKFCVTPTGGVSQISIMKGLDPEIDKEVIRVVSTLPAFRPGKQSGKPVPVWYILPVLFKISPM